MGFLPRDFDCYPEGLGGGFFHEPPALFNRHRLGKYLERAVIPNPARNARLLLGLRQQFAVFRLT